MKRFVFGLLAVVVLFTANVYAQSDCTAPHCGSNPLLDAVIGGDMSTAGYFQLDSGHEFYVRVRSAPAPGFEKLSPVYFTFPPGVYVTYDFLLFLHPDVTDWRGTLILDWASNHEPVIVEYTLYSYNSSGGWSTGHSNRILQQLIEPGCHLIPKPYNSTIDFAFYGTSEYFAQTVEIDGYMYIVPRQGLGHEQQIVVSGNTESLTVKVCVGVESATTPAGIDLTLPVYIAPKFIVPGGDVIYSDVWREPG